MATREPTWAWNLTRAAVVRSVVFRIISVESSGLEPGRKEC